MKELEYLARSCIAALADISDKEREELEKHILSAKHIFIFGVGRSGLVGQTFAIRLVQLGLRVYFVGDMTTPILEKDDLLILISNTGKTMSVTKTAEIAKRIGTRVTCVTSDKDSELAKISDTKIFVKQNRDEETEINAPLGTIFEDATILFFDSIIPNLMKKLGYSEQDMRNKHAIWV